MSLIRIAIIESLCAGITEVHTGEVLPASLLAEGMAMLVASCNALCGDSEIHVATILDSRTGDVGRLSESCHVTWGAELRLESHDIDFESYCAAIGDWAKQFDAVMVIAPETGGELQKLLAILRSRGCSMLNADHGFISMASDKVDTASYCNSMRIAHPRTWTLGDWMNCVEQVDQSLPFVLKPRDGAGSLDTYCFANAIDLKHFVDRSSSVIAKQTLVQEWVEGTACSRAVWFGRNQTYQLFPWFTQEFARHTPSNCPYEELHYLGGSPMVMSTDVMTAIDREFQHWIELLIQEHSNQLLGWCGFDMVLRLVGQRVDLVLIEINPRLTTSFTFMSDTCHERWRDCVKVASRSTSL